MLKFIDKAQLHAKGGKGGNGCVSFSREPYKPKGGPSGGSGGDGGNLYLRASYSVKTLSRFAKQPFWAAGNGGHGGSNKKKGECGKDVFVDVPVGTVVKEKSGQIRCELLKAGDKFLAARGGKGGHGNFHFIKEGIRLPKFAELGEEGEDIWYDLELKVLADVGIVGFPNAGKSSLIARLTNKKPKIADYPFTTLEPNLGILNVKSDEEDIVISIVDIPGIIEGASEGKGLGFEFLRHIEKCKILLFAIDLSSDEDPEETLNVLNQELLKYSEALVKKPRVVVGTKLDLVEGNPSFRKADLLVSSKTGQNIEKLTELISKTFLEMNESQQIERTQYNLIQREDHFRVQKADGCYCVYGKKARRAVSLTNIEDPQAMALIINRLEALGLSKELKKLGAKEGSIVNVYGVSFVYHS